MKKIVVFLIVIIVAVAGVFGYKRYFSKSEEKTIKKEEKKKLQIFDEDSDDRVIAVMINNNHAAWPHAGLQDSFLNYEIIVEGGISRIMALFKGVDSLPEKIGSIRSSRPYFLDYVLENDAIYVHWGGSDQAYSDIKSLNIDNIDGIYNEGTYFYRDNDYDRAYEHTGFTKGSMIKDAINNFGYRNDTKESPVFNYSVDKIDLKDMEGAIKADEIEINYSHYQTTNYTYDEENKVYLRSMSGTEHTDAVTGKQYTAKNIITYKVQNISLDEKDRQKLYNTGSGEGYYITNGYAVPITWEKETRSSKTVYKYASSGEEIKLNDGNTWVQIQPSSKYLGIDSNTEETLE